MLPSAQAFTHRAYRNLQDRAQKHSKSPDLVFLPKWQKQAAHKVMPRGQQFSQHPYVLGHLNRLGILNTGCQPQEEEGTSIPQLALPREKHQQSGPIQHGGARCSNWSQGNEHHRSWPRPQPGHRGASQMVQMRALAAHLACLSGSILHP